eukprot:1161821-Pelagomonas_calceolata.AAC.13
MTWGTIGARGHEKAIQTLEPSYDCSAPVGGTAAAAGRRGLPLQVGNSRSQEGNVKVDEKQEAAARRGLHPQVGNGTEGKQQRCVRWGASVWT